MTARISMLETIDGKQFKTRYYIQDRMLVSLKEDVIIAVKSKSSSIFVLIKNEDGIFDYVGNIQIDKETPTLAEIFIDTTGITSSKISVGSNVTVQLDIEASKKFKEKTFFDF